MAKTIYCPECARELCTVSHRQTLTITKRCNCGIYYKINPSTFGIKRTERPPRQSSSGAKFY